MWFSLSLALRFAELLESGNVCLSSNLGIFQPLFLQFFFCTNHFLLSFWDSNNTSHKPFDIVPWSVSSSFFSHFVSLYFSNWIISSALPSSQRFPLSSPLCYISHPGNFLFKYGGRGVLVLKFPFGCFYFYAENIYLSFF